jgi:zinc protease
VFSTPTLVQQDLAADLSATTAAQCLDEFRRTWSSRSLHVFVSTNPAFGVTSNQIALALNSSRATAVTRPVEKASVAFAYTNFGPPGRIVASTDVKDLEIKQAQFANGVRLSFKPTSFAVGSIDIAVRVGTGRLSQPRSQPGLDLFADDLMAYGGLGRHSLEDLQDALAGHALSVSFAVDNDALDFNARCAPQDLGLCMRLIAAYMTDAGYRTDALPMVRASMTTMYSSLASSPSGPISMNAARILSGGDLRFGTATAAEFNRLTVAEVRSWTDPQLKSGPIEIGIAGDTSWDAVAAEVGATLGALPPRLGRAPGTDFEDIHPPQDSAKAQYVYTTEPGQSLVALSRFCPVPDLRGFHMERRCRLLAALLAERLRVRLRMELGASYGFDADFYTLDGFPDFSFFSVSTTVSPEYAEKASELMGTRSIPCDEVGLLTMNLSG